jgi:ABC-2 type transport system permease protein
VFSIVLASPIERFPIYLLSVLLAWNLFSFGLTTGTGSVVSNAGIVGKVWFPREVLPLSAIGAALVHFFLQGIVLLIALLAFQHQVDWAFVPLLPFALFGLLLVLAGISLLFSAINVYLRDVQHLVELLLLAWFFACPIVYSYDLIATKLGKWAPLYLINPVTDVVLVFQRAIYGTSTNYVVHNFPVWWYVRNLVYVYVLGAVLFVFAMNVFRRLEGNFTEEL